MMRSSGTRTSATPSDVNVTYATVSLPAGALPDPGQAGGDVAGLMPGGLQQHVDDQVRGRVGQVVGQRA